MRQLVSKAKDQDSWCPMMKHIHGDLNDRGQLEAGRALAIFLLDVLQHGPPISIRRRQTFSRNLTRAPARAATVVLFHRPDLYNRSGTALRETGVVPENRE
jgi:hypothetical protein